jgi:hypothetical protein
MQAIAHMISRVQIAEVKVWLVNVGHDIPSFLSEERNAQ